jgi:seryl-tRNA(Sec) selenium transferase
MTDDQRRAADHQDIALLAGECVKLRDENARLRVEIDRLRVENERLRVDLIADGLGEIIRQDGTKLRAENEQLLEQLGAPRRGS